jgi:hypothetical protein
MAEEEEQHKIWKQRNLQQMDNRVQRDRRYLRRSVQNVFRLSFGIILMTLKELHQAFLNATSVVTHHEFYHRQKYILRRQKFIITNR